MDDLRIGSVARAVRHRQRLRQADLAGRAGVSQQEISLFERLGLTAVDLRTARRICAPLGMRLDVMPRWRGSDLDRLLDEAHAALVEETVRRLRAAAWETLVEWSFNHFGERGSVDLIGWRPASGHLVVNEIKSQVVDAQDLLSTLDRKARIAAELLPAERGWRVQSVSRLLIVGASTTARSAIDRHEATFDAAFPVRGRDVSSWLRHPEGAISGLLFVPITSGSGGKSFAPRRIRPTGGS